MFSSIKRLTFLRGFLSIRENTSISFIFSWTTSIFLRIITFFDADPNNGDGIMVEGPVKEGQRLLLNGTEKAQELVSSNFKAYIFVVNINP